MLSAQKHHLSKGAELLPQWSSCAVWRAVVAVGQKSHIDSGLVVELSWQGSIGLHPLLLHLDLDPPAQHLKELVAVPRAPGALAPVLSLLPSHDVSPDLPKGTAAAPGRHATACPHTAGLQPAVLQVSRLAAHTCLAKHCWDFSLMAISLGSSDAAAAVGIGGIPVFEHL